MKALRFFLLTLIVLLFCGCSVRHDYVWIEYPITEDRIAAQQYSENAAIKIIKGQSDDKIFKIGAIGPHNYFGSLQQLSDGIADQLAETLEIKGVTIDDKAQKSLTIRANSARFERGAWKVAATLDFEVEFADGKIKKYSVRNSSPTTVDNTYHGVVAIAVIEIINDSEIAAYINP